MLSTELQALRATNLNWAMMLRTVWDDEDDHEDVPELHADLRQEFVHTLEAMTASRSAASPPGWVITGEGGTGKTHLLAQFRTECVRRNACFVLIDLTDVRDFWETVANGYYHSLQQPLPDGTPQFVRLLSGMLGQLTLRAPVAAWVQKVGTLEADKVRTFSRNLLTALGQKYRAQSVEHANVVKAVVGLCGGDIEVGANAGTWLMGQELDPDAKASLGLYVARERGSNIVKGLSWLMSLAGFSVVALDQLDPIVTQLSLERDVLRSTPATAIINKLGMGLCELRDITQRTLAIVSCVDQTWRLLSEFTPPQYADRYLPARTLKPLQSEAVVGSILVNRLAPAAKAVGYKPPYPTWPFKPEWLATHRNSSPRELLKACHGHVGECLRRGKVVELPPGFAFPPPRPELELLDLRYLALRSAVDLAGVFATAKEDDVFGGIVQAAVQAVATEVELPPQVDVVAEKSFTGAKGNPPLHARLRLVFHGESSREEHVCLRALQQKYAEPFQARLRSAITFAGIDKALKFRQLFIIRRGPMPGGSVTKKLVDQFAEFGGRWLDPNDNDLRTLEALRVMLQEADPHLPAWMRARQHASKTALARTALEPLFRVLEAAGGGGASHPAETTAGANAPPPRPDDAFAPPPLPSGVLSVAPTPIVQPSAAWPAATLVVSPIGTPAAPSPALPAAVSPPAAVSTPTAVAAVALAVAPRLVDAVVLPPAAPKPTDLLLGRRLVAGSPVAQPTTIPVAALQKHGIVFAGAGSGKTVLLKRLIEGAALAGVPSIVVDCANDLASIGDPWPAPPAQWGPGDTALAVRFRDVTDLVVWTPNKDAGNPIGLEPLPDLTAVVGSPDEFKEAVAMAVDALAPVVATGTANKAAKKRAVLTKALEHLGRHGDCHLDGLAAVLGDFPAEATTGIKDEQRLAAAMADDLHAQLTINPLLRSAGPVLDPAVLLTGAGGKTRVSVVSLVGLGALSEQQHFVNQLAMTLFAWIKRHPTPPGRPLRGLLVIDEAKDFIPSGRSSPCLASMQRLAAQARKYGLGILLATQNPKDIDNKIVGQCSTHWYGKLNSPAAIDAAGELLAARGGRAGDEVGGLKAGTFYVSNADHLPGPMKLATPMCLSAHTGPMAPEAVVAKAAASRGGMTG